jgi:hypothetical protein
VYVLPALAPSEIGGGVSRPLRGERGLLAGDGMLRGERIDRGEGLVADRGELRRGDDVADTDRGDINPGSTDEIERRISVPGESLLKLAMVCDRDLNNERGDVTRLAKLLRSIDGMMLGVSLRLISASSSSMIQSDGEVGDGEMLRSLGSMPSSSSSSYWSWLSLSESLLYWNNSSRGLSRCGECAGNINGSLRDLLMMPPRLGVGLAI